jgi:hypothetical protein
MYRRYCLPFFLLLALAACNPSLGSGPGNDDDSGDDDDTTTGDDDDTNSADCREWDEVLNVSHELCRDAMGDMYYCGPDGICLEASGCEALDCCLPGEQGDRWCRDNYGDDSSCIAGPLDGSCGRNR